MAPAAHWSVEPFPIGFDPRINHLTTQQASPSGKGEGWTSRIFQLDGHHQTITARAVHGLTPRLDTAHAKRP